MALRFKSVLIVDPDHTGRRLLEKYCARKSALKVKSVRSAEEALCVRPYTFTCMWIECRLPGIDGLELALALRSGAGSPSIVPFLVGMSADLHRYNEEKCLRAGMNDFVEKPITREELERVMWGVR